MAAKQACSSGTAEVVNSALANAPFLPRACVLASAFPGPATRHTWRQDQGATLRTMDALSRCAYALLEWQWRAALAGEPFGICGIPSTYIRRHGICCWESLPSEVAGPTCWVPCQIPAYPGRVELGTGP